MPPLGVPPEGIPPEGMPPEGMPALKPPERLASKPPVPFAPRPFAPRPPVPRPLAPIPLVPRPFVPGPPVPLVPSPPVDGLRPFMPAPPCWQPHRTAAATTDDASPSHRFRLMRHLSPSFVALRSANSAARISPDERSRDARAPARAVWIPFRSVRRPIRPDSAGPPCSLLRTVRLWIGPLKRADSSDEAGGGQGQDCGGICPGARQSAAEVFEARPIADAFG